MSKALPRLFIIAAVAVTFTITGCTTTPSLTPEIAPIAEVEHSEVSAAAEAALADIRAHASYSFLEIMDYSEKLHAEMPDTFNTIAEQFESSNWVVLADRIEVNTLGTRAEVPVAKANEGAEPSGNSRLVIILEHGEWKLDDVLEFVGDQDMSMRESIENMYAAYSLQAD